MSSSDFSVNPVSENRWAIFVPRIAGLLALLVVASTLYGIWISLHPVTFKDSWEMLGLLDARGKELLAMLWTPWVEHRIPLPKLLYRLDLSVAEGTGYLLVFLNLVLQGVLAFLLVSVLRIGRGLGARERLLLGSLAVIACFWLVQSGNLLWGFQIAWFLNGLAAMGAFFLVAGFRAEAPAMDRWGRVAGAALAAAIAMASLANGPLLWPILIVVLWKAGASPRHLLVLAACAALAVGVYVMGLPRGASSEKSLVVYLHYVLVWLGNPVSRVNLAAGTFLGAFGALAFLVLAVRYLRKGRPGFLASVAFGQTAYSVGTALVTALGRAGAGAAHATSSRYYPPAILFWFFLLVLAGLAASRHPRFRKAFFIGTFAVVLPLVAAGQAASFPERAVRYLKTDHAALAVAAGVLDTGALEHIRLWPEQESFQEQIAFLKARGLSIYRDARYRAMGKPVAESFGIDSLAGYRSEIDEVEARGLPPRTGRFIRGTLRPATGTPTKDLLLFVEEGRVTGFARFQGRGCAGCFSGYASGPGAGPVGVYVLEDGSAVARSAESVLSP